MNNKKFFKVLGSLALSILMVFVLHGCGSTPSGGGTGTGGTGGGGVINPVHTQTTSGVVTITETNRVYTMTATVRETDGKAIYFTNRSSSGSAGYVSRTKAQEPNAFIDGRDFNYPSARVRTISNEPYEKAWDIGAFERRQIILDVIVGDPYDPFSLPPGFDGLVIPQSEFPTGFGNRQYLITYSGTDANGRAYNLTYSFVVTVNISVGDPYDPYNPGTGSGGGTGSDPNDPFGKISKK